MPRQRKQQPTIENAKEDYNQKIPDYLIDIVNYDGVLTSDEAQKIYKETKEKYKQEYEDTNTYYSDDDNISETPTDNELIEEAAVRTGTVIVVGKQLSKEEKAYRPKKPTQNITIGNNTYYRALIGVPEYKPASGKAKKSEIEQYQLNIIRNAMKYWDTNTPVEPYPDFFFDPDDFYMSVLNKTAAIDSLRSKINVDDPVAVLNYYGSSIKKAFYQEVPDKWRGEDKRKASKKTGVITYSTENPDGMYKDWRMPISFAYNTISVESSKLINKNYGTCNDMIIAGDIDWDATYVPEVGFIMYSEPTTVGRRKTMKTVYDMYETKDGMDMGKFFLDKLGRFGMVAMVECTLP